MSLWILDRILLYLLSVDRVIIILITVVDIINVITIIVGVVIMINVFNIANVNIAIIVILSITIILITNSYQAGYDVTIVDNLVNANPESIARVIRITECDPSRIRFYNADICDESQLEKVGR